MSLRRSIFSLGLFFTSVVLVFAVDLNVGTLNTYLFFDSSINHPGKVDDENRMTAAEYRTKIENLSTLVQGYTRTRKAGIKTADDAAIERCLRRR